MFFNFVLILIAFFYHGLTSAQSVSNRIIKKYGITEGLSQAVVNSIAQDNKGLMWFATEDGLNRFDGYSFTAFKFDTHSTSKFHDNFVQSLWKDDNGTLWVSSRRGLNKFDLSKEQFTSYIDEKFPQSNDVSYISQGSAGNLWMAFYGVGFASFDKQTEKVTSFNKHTFKDISTINTIITYEDSYGLLWIGTQDKGLNVFKVRNGKIEKPLAELSGVGKLPSLYVKCIKEDHLGNIWIGTTKGLALFLRQENEFKVLHLTQSPTESEGVFALHEDSNKTLWVGTNGEGFYTVDLKQFDDRHLEQLQPLHIKALDQFSIAHISVRAIFEDKDKNIWLGTSGDGIYMIGSETKKFFTIQAKEIINGAENFVSFNGLCNDKDGFIWAGTNGDGIYKLSTNGQIVRHYTADSKKGSIKENVVISAYRDQDDNLWFGTYSSGMFRYDRKSDSFIPYAHELSDAAVPLAGQVRTIYQDSKKNIWIGAARAGVCMVDNARKNFSNYAGNASLGNVDARAFAEDKEGGMWIGGYGDGLSHFDPETNKFTSYFRNTKPDNELKSNVIYALAFDKKGRLWIGSGGGGLGVYHVNDGTLKRYSVADGLINNTIYGLLIDDVGMIWVSTIKGISKFDPETKQFSNYTYADGLQEGQFNLGSSLYNAPKGYMCFGGALGLNLFYPSDIKRDSRTPKVMISGFQLFNTKVGVDSTENGLLNEVIDETQQITLKHDQSVFTLEFTALDYNYPQKNKYAYKLDGLDHEWNYAGSSRTATYRYLSPGSYEFKVKASQDNVWPDEFARIKIEVLPPFWKTPLAYFLYLLIAACIGYSIFLIRRRQQFLSERLRIEKALRVRQRHLVQEKLSFFTEVSHEFRTPLTLIIGPLEEILTREGNYTVMGKKLKMVYKNAHKLLNLINKLLDYRKVETGNMVLRVKEDNIVSFCEEIFITFKELAIRKNIKFEFHADHSSILTWFDKEKLEMVLNNILSNSFKYIGKGNAIVITVKKQQDPHAKERIVIEIKDDGIGIPKEQLKYIFDWYYQADNKNPVSSGIGLALAKKLIYLHKGQIYVTSTACQGSTFTIKIPIGREHFKPHEIVVDERSENLISIPDAVQFAEPDEAEAAALRKKGLKSILIVEDDEDVRNFLKDYFETRYKVYDARNGKEGLIVAEEANPDLIISDVMMPEMNGVDFCKQIKNVIKTSHIPVILLTAKTSFTHHKEGLEIGADAYITKPFSPEMLGLTVENLLQSQENLMRFYRSRFIKNSNGAEIKEAVSLDEKLLQRVYEFVKANLDNTDVNLDDVCDDLGMSRSLLYKKIKSLTGLSPVEYIRSLRLGEAASLLKSQKYKVFEVVYMVGFSDIKYFRQCFQKEFGYPPSSLLEKQ